MQFDKDAYEDFLTKHSKDKTEPVDLLERYAITLPATDAEIAAQLKAVRAYWNQHANGNARISKTAKWCRDQDERAEGQARRPAGDRRLVAGGGSRRSAEGTGGDPGPGRRAWPRTTASWAS